MHSIVSDALSRVLSGEALSREDALRLWDAPAEELFGAARTITRRLAPRAFNFCSIVNAKSGRCTEDCRWCAQSRHFATDAPEYPLIDEKTALEAARRTEAAGIPRFSFVTSGRKLSPREVRDLAKLVRAVRRETSVEVCVSAGLPRKRNCAFCETPASFATTATSKPPPTTSPRSALRTRRRTRSRRCSPPAARGSISARAASSGWARRPPTGSIWR